MPSPGSVGNPPITYTALSPGEPVAGGGSIVAGVVDLGNPAQTTLRELQQKLAAASGDADATLLAGQGDHAPRVLVPASSSLLGGVWTRFKAALAGLPLFNRMATLRSAQGAVSVGSSAVPLDGRWPVARSEFGQRVLSAIEAELASVEQGTEDGPGGPQQVTGALRGVAQSVHDAAFKEIEGKPLTKRTAARVLQLALDGAEAAKPVMALKRASLEQLKAVKEREQTAAPLNPRVTKEVARNAAARSRPVQKPAQDPLGTRPRDVSSTARAGAPRAKADVPPLEAALRPLIEGRHEPLLRHCVSLMQEKLKISDAVDAPRIAEAARELHDAVQARLLNRGYAPLFVAGRTGLSVSAEEFEKTLEPLAASLAGAGDLRFVDGRDARLLNHCAELVKSRIGTAYRSRILEEAQRLHDRIRSTMQQSARWPIADDREFEYAGEFATSLLSMQDE